MLPAPSNFRVVERTASSCTLEWDAVEGAMRYSIGRSNGPSRDIGNVTRFVDTAAASDETYQYRVMVFGVDQFGPAYSEWAFVTAKGKLSAPENLTGFDDSLTTNVLSWAAVNHAEEYHVLRDDREIAVVSETTFRDTDTSAGERYIYSVYASAENYRDSESSIQRLIIKKPQLPAPSIAVLDRDKTSVTLSISANSSVGQFQLYQDNNLIGIRTISGSSGVWKPTVTGLAEGRDYTFSVYLTWPPNYYDSRTVSLRLHLGYGFTAAERQEDYLRMLGKPFTKLCRLRFLNPNGSTAFALDNNRKNRRSGAFIADGSVNANYQNGQRLSASVTLSNADDAFEFSLNRIWFGQEIALDEGLVLSNGEEYWRQTGVFVLDNPQERIDPGSKTVTYHLLDKWADLDGTLDGNLEAAYAAEADSDIFEAMAALLREDRGNGRPVDRLAPVFTEYYNDKSQTLPNGDSRLMTRSPYELEIDGDGGTVGAVLLELAGMVNAELGYDNTGRLRAEPGQEDVSDRQKPVLYRFSQEETTLLGLSYTVKKSEVFNDYIVTGEHLDDFTQPGGRAMNYDPASDTNIQLIGRKTKRESAGSYATNRQCMDLAALRLKRSGALQKAVNISCAQMFHLELNTLVEVVRTDKPGSPRERHLVQGWSRPLSGNGPMTVSVVSVNDLASMTVIPWGNEES